MQRTYTVGTLFGLSQIIRATKVSLTEIKFCDSAVLVADATMYTCGPFVAIH